MSDNEKGSTSHDGIGHQEDGTLPSLPPDPDAHLSPEERAAIVSRYAVTTLHDDLLY
jgi:hypothetical protein